MISAKTQGILQKSRSPGSYIVAGLSFLYCCRVPDRCVKAPVRGGIIISGVPEPASVWCGRTLRQVPNTVSVRDI